MNKNCLILGIFFISLFVISCGIPEKSTSPELNGQEADSINDEEPSLVQNDGKNDKKDDVMKDSERDSELQVLIEKGLGVDVYQYRTTIQTRQLHGTYASHFYKIYRKGDLVKKEYLEAVSSNRGKYNEVYLNFAEKMAQGVCTKQSVACDEHRGIVYDLAFAEESSVVLLRQLLTEIPESAVIAGTGFIDRRKAVKVIYEEGSHEVELFLDSFSGLPLKKTTFLIADDEKVAQEIITITGLFTGGIGKADVAIPN